MPEIPYGVKTFLRLWNLFFSPFSLRMIMPEIAPGVKTFLRNLRKKIDAKSRPTLRLSKTYAKPLPQAKSRPTLEFRREKLV